jgi:cyclophilin family peptidyl-prolyl cis-trans isomerase
MLTSKMPRGRQKFAMQSFRPAVIGLVVVLTATTFGCRRQAADSASAKNQSSAKSGSKAPGPKINYENPVVRIETDKGTIAVRLDGTRAPGTVRNFLYYVNSRFYDNTLVHYVDPGKMILAGGYAADGKAKPALTPIRNEAHNGTKNVRGTVAMARDQASIDGATSQFFINLTDAPQRDHRGDSAAEYGYCVFGEVTEGLDVAEQISQSPTKSMGGDLVQTPDPPVVIKSVRIAR